jgi:predicted TPR repeat methyltransferase
MRMDEIKRIYRGFSKSYEKDVKELMNYTAYIRVPKLVIGHLNTSKPKILDLGCGTGLSSLLFFKRGCEVTGIDGTRDMIERAKRLPYKMLICQNLEKRWRVRDQSFDAVVMIGVMEYINDPAALFKQVKKKLVDGGVFGLTVPQKNSWYSESGLRSYYRKEIEPIMSRRGFTIIEREKIVGVEDDDQRAYYRNYVLRKTRAN